MELNNFADWVCPVLEHHPEFNAEIVKDPCTGNDMIKINYHCLQQVMNTLPKYFKPHTSQDITVKSAKNALIGFEDILHIPSRDEVHRIFIDSFKFNHKEEVIKWNSMKISLM